jgi:hypothetical protein
VAFWSLATSDHLVILAHVIEMAGVFQYSPFVSISASTQPLLSEVDILRNGHSLDHLGDSTAGELYWNSSLAGLGLVCGSSVSILSLI